MPYYLFDHIPGAHHTWTLAVLATSEKDARDYVKNHHGNGKLQRVIRDGNVPAHCGPITRAAEDQIKNDISLYL